MTKIKQFQANDGVLFPAVGLGTVQIKGAEGITSILSGIDNGYRLLDTSTNYNNEGMVGEAIRRSTVPREKLIVTSKLPGHSHSYERAILMIQESLYRMGLDYFDNYLIHWPLPKQDHYVEAWKALIDAQKFGLIQSIGVSNFTKEHLDRIIDETGVTPSINQIERHPYFNNKAVIEANKELGIITEAWSPFTRNINAIKSNQTLKGIAKKYNKSEAQIVLRWNYENEVLSVVKSASPKHQKANLNIFDFSLTDEDKQQIDSLDKGEAGRIEGQNPDTYEEFE